MIKIKPRAFTVSLILIPVIFLNLGISGCTLVSNLLEGGKVPESGQILFSDDFDDNQNHWGTMGRIGGEIGVQYGGLVIRVDVTNFLFWTTSGAEYTDVQIDVDAVLLEGPVNDSFGVVCRYQDDDHFYGFLITHDGYYGIFKMLDGEIILLTGEGNMQYSDEIRQGGTVNHLSAVCAGDTLSLSINDKLMVGIEDESYTSGQVGLTAGTYHEPGVKVFFDNFVVRQP